MKERVDAGRAEDNVREKERVKAKRQKTKDQIRGKKTDEDDGSEMEGGAPQLGGYSKFAAGSEEGGDSSSNSMDTSGDSDSDSDSGDGEADAAALEKQALAMIGA